MCYKKHDSVVKNLGDVDVDTWICVKHGPFVRNLGDDDLALSDYEKHDRIVRNLSEVDVIHVDSRETLPGHEKPRERRSNTRGL